MEFKTTNKTNHNSSNKRNFKTRDEEEWGVVFTRISDFIFFKSKWPLDSYLGKSPKIPREGLGTNRVG